MRNKVDNHQEYKYGLSGQLCIYKANTCSFEKTKQVIIFVCF